MQIKQHAKCNWNKKKTLKREMKYQILIYNELFHIATFQTICFQIIVTEI